MGIDRGNNCIVDVDVQESTRVIVGIRIHLKLVETFSAASEHSFGKIRQCTVNSCNLQKSTENVYIATGAYSEENKICEAPRKGTLVNSKRIKKQKKKKQKYD